MQSWRLRQPSLHLEQNLFPEEEPALPLSWSAILRWSAPAALAAFLLVASRPEWPTEDPALPLEAVSLSNSTSSYFGSPSAAPRRNEIPSRMLAFTNVSAVHIF
jgi:hypothetical protein